MDASRTEPPSTDHVGDCYRILQAEFEDERSLRRFLRRSFGRDIVDVLPGEGAEVESVYSEAALALERRGHWNTETLSLLLGHDLAIEGGQAARIQQVARVIGLPELAPTRTGMLGQAPHWHPGALSALAASAFAVVLASRTPILSSSWVIPGLMWVGLGTAVCAALVSAPEYAWRFSGWTSKLGTWLRALRADDIVRLATDGLVAVYGPRSLSARSFGATFVLATIPMVLCAVVVGAGAELTLAWVAILWVGNVLADFLSQAHTHELLREIRPATPVRLLVVLCVDLILIGVLAGLPVLAANALTHATFHSGELFGAAAIGPSGLINPLAWSDLAFGSPAGRGFLVVSSMTSCLPSLMLWALVAMALVATLGDGWVYRAVGRAIVLVSADRKGTLGVAYAAATALGLATAAVWS